ncbi:hypothetical protein H5410_037883 [Solanum commersonii]|uniref:Uncharacterized protein n=1 Tax=Solanum commersonii TaxID=4109 RepID=A0A9J5Y7H6_SOLCO|nr:hypothetical protein H5410_037883 [Solanum commersonii]
MSEKSANAPISPIALVSDEETKESMFKKFIETKERIAAAKRRLAILDQTEWILRERIIEVDMETTSVKRKITKIDQEIINITKTSARIPEIERDSKKLNFGNASSMRGNDRTKEGSDDESTGLSPYRPITSTYNPHTIDLTVSNAPYANTFYQTPPLLPNQSQAPNTNHSQNFMPTYQIPLPVPNNPNVLPSQLAQPSVTFQTPPAYTISEPCPSFPTTEDYREYACHWKKEAAKVQPVMTEREITSTFIRAQEPEYYERMLPMMGTKFWVDRIGEAIEDGLKSRKVTSLTALQAANKSSPFMATGFARKKKEDVSTVSFSPRPRPQRYFGSGSAIFPVL